MNKFLGGAAIAAAVLVGSAVYVVGGIEHIGLGEVGVVKHFDGTVTEIGQGWNWVGWSASAQSYPTYRQSLGGKDGVLLKIGTSDQQELDVTANLNWSIDPAKSKELVQSVGGNKIDYVSDTIVNTVMKNDVNKVTHTYGWNDIKGNKQAEVTDKIAEMIKVDLAKSGIELVNFGFSQVGSPKGMEDSQKALASAELGKQQASANQQKQTIENETAIAKATADAQVKQIEATATAKQAAALNELVIQKEWIAKWDGKLPTMTVGDKTMVQVPAPTPVK